MKMNIAEPHIYAIDTRWGTMKIPVAGGCDKWHERAYRLGHRRIRPSAKALRCAVRDCLLHGTLACTHLGLYGGDKETDASVQRFKRELTTIVLNGNIQARFIGEKYGNWIKYDDYLDHLGGFRYRNNHVSAKFSDLVRSRQLLTPNQRLSREISFLEKHVPVDINFDGVSPNDSKILCPIDVFNGHMIIASSLCVRGMVRCIRRVERILEGQ